MKQITLFLLLSCVSISCLDSGGKHDDFFIEIKNQRLRQILNRYAEKCKVSQKGLRVEVIINSFGMNEIDMTLILMTNIAPYGKDFFLNYPIADHASVINGRVFLIHSGLDLLKNGMYLKRTEKNIPNSVNKDSLQKAVIRKILPYLTFKQPSIENNFPRCFPTRITMKDSSVIIMENVYNPFFINY